MDTIENFRAQFSQDRKYVPFNNAGTSLLSRPARQAIEKWTTRFFDEGVAAIPSAYQEANHVRETLAHLLGAETLAFFPNTAAAISQVALGLKFNIGDEILVWDQEYPSNHYPWQEAARRSGAKLILVPSGPNLETPVETLERYVTPKTGVIAFSWIQFRSGAETNIRQLTAFAKSRGILTCADIIQGAGILPFHFTQSGLDAACGGSHKWMCSVSSAAYLLTTPRLMQSLLPVSVGAMTFGTSEDAINLNAVPKTTPHRFEPGSLSLLDILALGASVKLIEETGIERIAQEAEWLARKLTHGLSERGYIINSPHGAKFRGVIVNFSPGPDARRKSNTEIAAALNADSISFAQRPPGIRVSCHAYNTEADIERLLNALS